MVFCRRFAIGETSHEDYYAYARPLKKVAMRGSNRADDFVENIMGFKFKVSGVRCQVSGVSPAAGLNRCRAN